ncbi:MAG: YfhO family protein, partial [Myxococcota bacterium]
DRENIFLKPYHQERRVLSDLADGEDRVFTLFVGDMGDVSEKLASLSRIRSISDYEIMTLQRQREYFSYLFWGETSPNAVNREGHSQKIFYGYYHLLAPGIDPKAVASRNRLVDLAAARHLLVPRSGASTRVVRSYLREAGLRPIDLRDPQIMVFENARALPRAYVTHRVEPAPGTEELLAKLASPDFDPREQSYLELDSLPEPELAPAQRSERVAIVRDTLHEVALEVELDAPGVVILSDSYYPGWRASVDGEPVPIYAANHLFRGVAVGAGVHEVRFLYEPSSVRIGAGLSLLGVVVLVGLFVAARREGRDTLLDSSRTR